MRLILPVALIAIFIFLIDGYLFKALRLFSKNILNRKIKIALYLFHWFIPLFTIGVFLYINTKVSQARNPESYQFVFNMFGVFVLIYFPKIIFLIFHLLEDISFLLIRFFNKSKKRFLIVSKIGFFVAVLPIFFISYGMIWGKYNYQVRTEQLSFSNLPSAFNHLKIVQISDLHLGSFAGNKSHLEKIVEIINQQNPDLILFTGDLVNNFAEEIYGFEKTFLKMKAKYAKFAIMGNHDYGDYFQWPNINDRTLNFQQFQTNVRTLGFKMLLNSFDSISVNNQSIGIIGVENWGKPPFKQYGDIQAATKGTEHFPFKILLSHDPDYWRAAILKQTNIDLTLSGHTHGMQMGCEINGNRYSFAKLRFKEWGGLYSENQQYLYVNVGTGFIGLPDRIGMPPEITVIELVKK